VYLIGPAAASFSLCLLAMFALRPVAIAVNLIDRPGGRKTHVGEVPVVGGLAMLLGIMLGMGLTPLPGHTTSTLLAASAMLVTIGLIDDRFDLSPWMRLPAQLAAAVLLMLGTEAVISAIGSPWSAHDLYLEGWWSYVFTILTTIAAINAFNMLDGMDGLAGAMALVAFIAIAYLAYEAGLPVALSASIVFTGAVLAFLVSNIPFGLNDEIRCFMGDSGSTLLGFLVVWLCINVSQSPVPAAEPVTLLWVVALPLYELFWTVLRRTLRGISPFKPDNGHFHHRLFRAGFGVRPTFVILVALAIVLALFGVLIDRLGIADRWSFALLVAFGVLVVRLMHRAERLWRLFPVSMRPESPTSSSS
jgi:UDP-GlcNAc:undecaprenyl-phosphate/decaprenyl-phosphate GlcNAc-1-phosphate transferase